jgi:glyoxylase-like metal-dependent hydrolase (beta-lactamase superfamily II)
MDARPVITYDDKMQIHFNGEQIDLMHFGPAHTTGDTAIIFRGRNAVHLGDVFNNSGYPFIDADNGGSIDGIISFCSAVRDELNEDSTVIPGHGPVTDYQALTDYIDMLKVVRDRIAGMIGEGKSLEEVIAAKPTAEFDERYGDPGLVVDRAYTSLAK